MSLRDRILLGAVMLGMTACASLEKTEPAKPAQATLPTVGLQAQELASSECGIFFWSNALPRTFVFFHKQGEANAKYYLQGAEIAVQTSQNTNSIADGTGLLIDYTGAGFQAFSIKGQFTDLIEGGRRISNATIKTKKPDEWEEIHPVSGVYVCR